MGKPTIEKDVQLFIAITFTPNFNYQQIKSILSERFGNIILESPIFDFNFTEYYTAEMGSELKKQFIGFQRLIRPEQLVEIKLWTNELEEQFSINDNRQVNLDPGYLTTAKIVLATTKNFSHRIYLGKGIYGDIHLRYMNGRFQFFDWTYRDYRQELVVNFFSELRNLYKQKGESLGKAIKDRSIRRG